MKAEAIVNRLAARLLGQPLLRNSIRGELVEEIVAVAMEPDWELCGGDWGSCDLRQRRTGLRIQVKQSAARQSWHSRECPPVRPRFSIAEKTGRWEEVVAPLTPGAPPPPSRRRRSSPRIDIVCGKCGGNNVSRDAWADWDSDEQVWVLGAVFDYGHCHDCDGEASLEEVALDATATTESDRPASRFRFARRPSAIGISRSLTAPRS